MNIHTKAVHVGDRKKLPAAVPSTVPIFTASSFSYAEMADLDKVFGGELDGYCYSRYDTPTTHALEEQVNALEDGAGALATSSGMSALQVALQAALADRRRSVLAASAIYGATMRLLNSLFEPMGVDVNYVDICDEEAVASAMAEHKPGCVLMESLSNPLLRVGPIDRIATLARQAGAALIVDSTFATPMLMQPLALGAHLVVHSLTKFLAGHGDVLGGIVVSDEEHLPMLRAIGKTSGPGLGPFESYLSMRGVKTFPLRMERQCANACKAAQWLAAHPAVERVYYPADPKHADAETIARLLAGKPHGAMVSFDLKDATRERVFAFMDRLKLVVRATTLGDVHTLALYPAMSSHRDLAPKQRHRLGIGDGLIRLSVGIEAPEDIIDDLEQAL
ncbi:MAG: PLP-dependent transferase [Bryobacterales bacterium]|nr:PLP-dependent transferase [Bryobacterales bacterium]